jgi:hypothetical protein
VFPELPAVAKAMPEPPITSPVFPPAPPACVESVDPLRSEAFPELGPTDASVTVIAPVLTRKPIES